MPILTLDLESTGTDVVKDRIVQIAFALGDEEPRKRLINPGIPIPAEATAIHGITDEMVADAPIFRQVAKSLLEKLTEAEAISGFNVESFDLPLLSEEFARIGIVWPAERPKIIDVYKLYTHWYPRKLANAVATYCGREQTAAHDAGGDVIDSRDVLAVMRQRADFDAALVETHDKGQIDLAGKLVRDAEGDAVYTFGQHRGRKLREEPGFARWMLGKDFPADTKRAVEAELARINGTLQYTVAGETYGVSLQVKSYGGGRPALTLESIHGRVAVATVNLPDAELPKGYLHIKTWSENEGMLKFLVDNGIVIDTGEDVDTGSPFVKARLVKKGPNYPGPREDVAA